MLAHEILLDYAEGAPPVHCTSAEELLEVLREIHQVSDPEYPAAVDVSVPGYRLRIGLGSDPTFVQIQDDGAGAHYLSLGDPAAAGEKAFYRSGSHTSYAARCLIPLSHALEAVRVAIETRSVQGTGLVKQE